MGPGDAHLCTTQRYLNPLTEDVIDGMLAFHARHKDHGPRTPMPGYRPESVNVLFGPEAS